MAFYDEQTCGMKYQGFAQALADHDGFKPNQLQGSIDVIYQVL
jgi:hypothetical protein